MADRDDMSRQIFGPASMMDEIPSRAVRDWLRQQQEKPDNERIQKFIKEHFVNRQAIADRIKKNAEVAQAWADGRKIQYRADGAANWLDFGIVDVPKFYSDIEYRVKPEPREWWANVYECEEAYLYDTKAEADDGAGDNRKECIRIREVLE